MEEKLWIFTRLGRFEFESGDWTWQTLGEGRKRDHLEFIYATQLQIHLVYVVIVLFGTNRLGGFPFVGHNRRGSQIEHFSEIDLKIVDFDGRLHGILPLDDQSISHLGYLDVFGTKR